MTKLKMLRAEFEALSALCWEVGGLALRDALSERIEESVTKVDAALKAVEDEQRWIPVEEGPPKSDDLILVVTDEKKVLRARYLRKQDLENIEWEIDGILGEGFYEDCEYDESFWEIIGVTHWRPLPEHPRKKEVQE